MGAGVFLAVVGAILAFAVRAELAGFNVQVAGLILMIAGGVLIWDARRGRTRERIVTRVEESGDTSQPPRTVEQRETIIHRDMD